MIEDKKEESLIGMFISQAVTVVVIFFVMRLLGDHIWGFLGTLGAILLGGMALIQGVMNCCMLFVAVLSKDEMAKEGSSYFGSLCLLVLKLGVDVLAGYLAITLWSRF